MTSRHVYWLLPFMLPAAGCHSLDWNVGVEGGVQPSIVRSSAAGSATSSGLGDANPYVRVTGALRPRR
jgi:hypothetical protein